jgi:hypothetical protein
MQARFGRWNGLRLIVLWWGWYRWKYPRNIRVQIWADRFRTVPSTLTLAIVFAPRR